MFSIEDDPQRQEYQIKKIKDYTYKTTELLGMGNFSKVYQGINQQTNQKVAIKVIELSSMKSTKLEELLNSQIQLLKKLKHQNIVQCYDVLKSLNNCYIVTELCGQGDLQKKLKKRGVFMEQEIYSYIKDIHEGLQYLAEQGIVHRDLKVSNIFIKEGVAKIADFGFAHATRENFTDISIGSPLYMSPQGFLKNSYGPKTDIWAFGILLYELTHGFTPYNGCLNEKDLSIQLQKQLNINDLRNSLSNGLKNLIIRCLDCNQNTRISMVEIKNSQFINKVYTLTNGRKICKDLQQRSKSLLNKQNGQKKSTGERYSLLASPKNKQKYIYRIEKSNKYLDNDKIPIQLNSKFNHHQPQDNNTIKVNSNNKLDTKIHNRFDKINSQLAKNISKLDGLRQKNQMEYPNYKYNQYKFITDKSNQKSTQLPKQSKTQILSASVQKKIFEDKRQPIYCNLQNHYKNKYYTQHQSSSNIYSGQYKNPYQFSIRDDINIYLDQEIGKNVKQKENQKYSNNKNKKQSPINKDYKHFLTEEDKINKKNSYKIGNYTHLINAINLPKSIYFVEAVALLHYCRLCYKYLNLLKELSLSDQKIQDKYSSWIILILTQIINKIDHKNIHYERSKHDKQSKFKEVVSEYLKKYTQNFQKEKYHISYTLNTDEMVGFINNDYRRLDEILPKKYTQNHLLTTYYALILSSYTEKLKKCQLKANFQEFYLTQIQQTLNFKKNAITMDLYLMARRRKNFNK